MRYNDDDMKIFCLHNKVIKKVYNPIFFFLAMGIFFMVGNSVVYASVLSFSTKYDQYNQGDTFLTSIQLDTEGQCVNTVDISVAFDPATLQAVGFEEGGSIVSLWVEEPAIDQEKGIIHFSGGIPGGYCGHITGDPGPSDILGKIAFTTAGARIASDIPVSTALSFTEESQVFLHDGQGTPTEIRSLPYIVVVVRNIDGVIENEWLENIKEDTIAPELFTVTIYKDPLLEGGKNVAVFSAQDKQSGIHHYEVLETDLSRFGFLRDTDKVAYWVEAESPYVLRDQNLKSRIMVKAVDEAGNERVFEYIPETSLKRAISGFGVWGSSLVFFMLVFLTAIAYRKLNNKIAQSSNVGSKQKDHDDQLNDISNDDTEK